MRHLDVRGTWIAKSPLRFGHPLLFFAIMAEVFSLELIPTGVWHFVFDGLILGCFAIGVRNITKSNSSAIVCLALGITAWLVPQFQPPFEANALLWASLHLYVAYCLGARVFRVRVVHAGELIDSITVYLLVGLAFANLYSMAIYANPHALEHQTDSEPLRYSLVVYYSLVTQMTVGYGDIAPTTSLTRSLSMLQALFGVFYVAILVARFVSLHTVAIVDASQGEGKPRTLLDET